MIKYFILFSILIAACSDRKLPVLGQSGENDKAAHTISPFSFVNQDTIKVTEQTFNEKIFVADFIFLSCATICPKMNIEMLKVYKNFEKDDRVLFISHTIDPEHDSIPRLKNLANNLQVSSKKWHFVTGHVDSIYKMAEKSYFTNAYPDSSDKSNFIHGGGLLLVDKHKQIRGVYDGTDQSETERLINDIKLLLKEQF